jgi:serine/threonine protein kinase
MMADEAKAERYCPLCDGETDAALCPIDGVATLPSSLVALGGGGEVELGAVFAGRYRIERVLGEGGFGRVYVATQLSMGREVALKTLHAKLLGDRNHLRRFYREARSASQLDSPHVVRMYDFGVDEVTGTPFLAMEYLKGEPLNEVMGKGVSMSLARAARITGQVAQALAEAHEAGIVHRDLKPANIFLLAARGGREFAKVMDFGIAKVLRHDDVDTGESLTATGTTVGTPRYMSPEQATAEKVDFRSDLYALGCILHEMITGRQVFEAEDRVSLLLKHVTVQPPALPDVLPGGEALPKALGDLHRSMLSKLRDQRPSNCRVVVDVCEAVEHGRHVDAQAMLIEARTGPMAAATAETVGDPVSETMPLGAPQPTSPPQPAGLTPSTRPVPTGAALSQTALASSPPSGTGENVSSEAEASTVFAPDTPSAPVVPLPARPTAVDASSQGAAVDTTDGNPSLGMGVADIAALQRAARGQSRWRTSFAVLAAFVVGAVAVGVVVALPDGASDVAQGGSEVAGEPAARSAAVSAPPSGPAAAKEAKVAAPESTGAKTPAPSEPKPREAVPTAGAAAPAASAKAARAPEPEPARVVFRSRPPGAMVEREGKELCRTPCDLSLDPVAEPVRMRLVLKGYEPNELVLSIRPGVDIMRDVVLTRKRAAKRRSRPSTKTEAPKLPGIRATEAPVEEAPPKPKKTLPGLRMTE